MRINVYVQPYQRSSQWIAASMSYHLIDLVQQLGTPKVLVVGDLILDRYVWGDASRISQEAPVILLNEDHQETRLGGTANVANMLRGLDAEVTMAGVVGDDPDGDVVRQSLEQVGAGCDCLLTDDSRPTTVKERLIGRAQNRHPHQMLRVDRESKEPLTPPMAAALSKTIEETITEYQAVLISDYSKGVCTPEVLSRTIQAAKAHNIPVIVDPGSAADYENYRGVSAITPNRLETKLATNREITNTADAFTAGGELCHKYDLDCVFVTLDSDGVAVVTASGSEDLYPTRKREVYDITGAGDMVLATIGVGMAAGIAWGDLARLANVAGGLEVEQIGVVNITRQQMIADMLHGSRGSGQKVGSLDQLSRHIDARRGLGQRIVMTNGCFDVLHVGHVTYLEQAAEEGDCLVVALNSDDSIRGLGKGDDRPVFAQDLRARMLAALEAVDYVVVFDEATPHQVIESLKPDILVKGGTYSVEEIVGREVVEAYGGEVKALGQVPGVSTTAILQALRSEGSPQSIPFQVTPTDDSGEDIDPITRRKAG